MKCVVNPGVLAVILFTVFAMGVPSDGWTNIASAKVQGRNSRLAVPVPKGRAPWDCRLEYPAAGGQTSRSVKTADTSRSATSTADSQSNPGRCAHPNQSLWSWSEQGAAVGDDQGTAMAACPQVVAFPAPVPWRAALVP